MAIDVSEAAFKSNPGMALIKSESRTLAFAAALRVTGRLDRLRRDGIESDDEGSGMDDDSLTVGSLLRPVAHDAGIAIFALDDPVTTDPRWQEAARRIVVEELLAAGVTDAAV